MHATAFSSAPPPFGSISFRYASPTIPLILVDVQVNERGPFTFVLDTGARTCLMDTELARELRITQTGNDARMGAGGAVQVAIGHAASIMVGRTKIEDIEVGITAELTRISAATGTAIRGALGQNFFHNIALTIDWSTSRLTLSQAVDPLSSAVHTVPFALLGKKPLIVVAALVNASGPYQFVLDTGATATVIDSSLAKKLGIAGSDTGARLTGAGSSGQRVLAATLAWLRIGEAEARDLAVGIVDFLPAIGAQVESQLDGIIGFDFLKQYRLTIDYRSRQVVLTPVSK